MEIRSSISILDLLFMMSIRHLMGYVKYSPELEKEV